MILRQSDNLAWTAQADDTLGIRQYYCQNWRADISALVSDTGKMVEWVKYSSYGVPTALPCGDTDSDGDWDATDSGAITGGYEVRKDAELDGDVDASDITRANAITGSYQTLGRGLQSSTAVANRKGYAGYEYDPVPEGAGRHLSHVRNRVYDADLGRWTRRDPAHDVDGPSLYEYSLSEPISHVDPAGLARLPCHPPNCVTAPTEPQPMGPPPPPVNQRDCWAKKSRVECLLCCGTIDDYEEQRKCENMCKIGHRKACAIITTEKVCGPERELSRQLESAVRMWPEHAGTWGECILRVMWQVTYGMDCHFETVCNNGDILSTTPSFIETTRIEHPTDTLRGMLDHGTCCTPGPPRICERGSYKEPNLPGSTDPYSMPRPTIGPIPYSTPK